MSDGASVKNNRFLPVLCWLGILSVVSVLSLLGSAVLDSDFALRQEKHLVDDVLRKDARDKFYSDRWGYNFAGPFVDSWDQIAYGILPQFDSEKTSTVIIGPSLVQQSWLPEEENSLPEVCNLACGDMAPKELVTILQYLRDEKSFFKTGKKTVIVGVYRAMVASEREKGQLTRTLDHAWTFNVVDGQLKDRNFPLKETRLNTYRWKTLLWQLTEQQTVNIFRKAAGLKDERNVDNQKLPPPKTSEKVIPSELEKKLKQYSVNSATQEATKICQENGVRLIFVMFPRYSATRYTADTAATIQVMKQFCEEQKIEFYDWSGLLQDSDFYDHMSHPLFRGRLIEHHELLKIIRENKSIDRTIQ